MRDNNDDDDDEGGGSAISVASSLSILVTEDLAEKLPRPGTIVAVVVFQCPARVGG